MVQSKLRSVLAAKIETTPGTAETLAAADAAMNIYNGMIQPTISIEQRQGQGGYGKLAGVPAGRIGVATFRTYLEWDGTATEPLWAETFFPACGWVKTGQVYTPRSEAPGTNVKTLTIGLYQHDGATGTVFYSIAGAMGTAVVTLPTGDQGYIDWTFTGTWQAPTNETMLTPTYPTAKGLRFAGGLAEYDNINMCVSEATISLGNEVVMRECPTTASGYITAFIADRTPIITANPESRPLATMNLWQEMLDSGENTLELDIAGPTTAVLSFDAPKAQVVNIQRGDRAKIAIEDVEWQCNKNGATHDEELSITFTAAV